MLKRGKFKGFPPPKNEPPVLKTDNFSDLMVDENRETKINGREIECAEMLIENKNPGLLLSATGFS